MKPEETVQIISGIEGTKFISGGMFFKETRIKSPQKEQNKVDKLRAAQVPLPDIVKFTQNRMEATDMTEGGKNTIIDTHTHKPINLKNLDEVKAQIERIGKLAFNVGIVLGMDNYAVVVDKTTQRGRAVVLDVTSLREKDNRDTLDQVKNSSDAFNDIVESKIQK